VDVTANTARRRRLCDAAVTVIARSGLRGLTHRAVDRAAGVPAGSTSYYYRTRLALLTAVTGRLAEVDLADLPAPAIVTPPRGGDVDLDRVADLTAQIVAHRVGPGRDRMLARYELSLEAARRPQLRAALAGAGAGWRTAAAEFLAAAGASDPVRQGRDLLSCVDGLIYDQLAGAGGPRPVEEVRHTVREILRGLIGR
jgi:DNA-binding transcriptional regulator YbjK